MDRTIEHVRGTVIGPMTLMAAVYTPNKTPYGNARQFEQEELAREWAKSVKAKALAEVGNAEAGRLGWRGSWELRIWY